MSNMLQTPNSQDTTPEQQLIQMIWGKMKSQMLSVVAELGIADLLKDGSRPIEELAEITNTHKPTLYRVMRSLANEGVFVEVNQYIFTLNPIAERLQSDFPGSLRAIAIFWGKEWHNKAWSNLMHSVKTGECAFDYTFGTKVFDFLSQNPEDFSIFNEAMTSGTSQSALKICQAYDFSNFHTIVDVGGGQGFLLKTILETYPHLKGTLFDLPSVVKEANNEGLHDRFQIVEGDFFESVPEGADAYILKHIIHDWNNERAGKILENCKNAMKPESKVLIVDAVIPSDNRYFSTKLVDIEMLVLPGGQERTESEFQNLLSSAGLTLNRIIPTIATQSIIEGIIG